MAHWCEWDRQFMRLYYHRFGALIAKLVGKSEIAVKGFAQRNGLTVDAETHMRRTWGTRGQRKRGPKGTAKKQRRADPTHEEVWEMAAEIRRQRGDQ